MMTVSQVCQTNYYQTSSKLIFLSLLYNSFEKKEGVIAKNLLKQILHTNSFIHFFFISLK